MSKKFHAIHRLTNERWTSKKDVHQYLVMYDSGYLAVVTTDFYTTIEPLDPKTWRVVHKKDNKTSQNGH
jgi:hypothetical protein